MPELRLVNDRTKAIVETPTQELRLFPNLLAHVEIAFWHSHLKESQGCDDLGDEA